MKREQKRLIKNISNWMLTNGIKNFIVLDDLSVNVRGDVDLSRRGISELPPYIVFNEVWGSFDCSENSMTTLRGCPRLVTGNFYCYMNGLTSLDHAPAEVRGKFFCHKNSRQFTMGDVASVCDVSVVHCG